MRKHLFYLLLCLATASLATSCESIKRFLNKDLEEEDFSMGELYVDEYVKEVPYVPTPSAEARRSGDDPLFRGNMGELDHPL